ncbi:MAG: energy transducer TonB, partial [Gammaproteobacteria bacterium]
QVFSQYFHYPRLARRNGWQGMVKLSLRIEPNGELSHVRVLETSGFEILDQAAIESVNKISAIPGADDWLRGSHFDTVLPVRYQLIHG